jgi:hypothetical protein
MDETLELRRLLRAIASAADNAALRHAAEEARVLEHGAVAPAPAETATRLISAVSDALTRRAITLAQARSPQAAQLRW